MILGGLVGGLGGEDAARYVGWMGTLFVRLLRMVIVPLILSSIVSGIASVGAGKSLGRLGAKTFAYYVSTSMLAIVVGLFLVGIHVVLSARIRERHRLAGILRKMTRSNRT